MSYEIFCSRCNKVIYYAEDEPDYVLECDCGYKYILDCMSSGGFR